MELRHEKWMEKAARVGGLVLGALFIASGAMKLLQLSMAVQMFEAFGLPRWTLIAVGLFEVVSGALLLARSTRFFGALGVCAVMLGAAAVHVVTEVNLPMVFLNGALFAAAAWVASKSGNTLLGWDGEAAYPRNRRMTAG